MRLPLFAAVVCAALAAPLTARAGLDPYLPPDTQLYLSIDVRKAFDSDLFKNHVLGPARDALKALEGAQTVLDDLGLDPFKHIDRLVLAAPTAKRDADRGLIVAHGTFDAAKLKARAAKLKKADDESVKVHEVPLGGGAKQDVYEIAVPGQDLSLYVALASPKAVLVSPGKDYVVEALKQGRAGKKPELKDKALGALIERLDPKQALSLAMPGKLLAAALGDADGLPGGTGGVLESIDAVGGGLTVGDEIKLDLAITAKEADNARTIRDYAEKGAKLGVAALALLGGESPAATLGFELLKSVKVSGKGKVVAVAAALKAAVIRDLFGKD